MAFVEDISKRNQKAKHFYDAVTGKWMAEFTIADRHYHDGNAWQDVDESLVTDGLDGFARKCDKTRHVFRVANGGTQRWYPRRRITTEYIAILNIQYYTNRWRNLNLPTPVWRGNGADWDMANLHATLTNSWRQIKTSFIFKDSTAPTRLRFELGLTGLTLDTNTWEVKSGTDVIGSIPPPIFTDANDADVPVTTTWDGTYIEWSINPSGYTYPLTSHSVTFQDGNADPGGEVEYVNTAKDTLVRSSQTTYNYGATTGWNGTTYKFLAEFNLSSIPATATCDSAHLHIYCAVAGAAGAFTHTWYAIASGNDGWIEGTRIAQQALEGEPTWAGKEADGAGGVTTAWAGSAGLSTVNDDYEADSIGSFNGNRDDPAGTDFDAALTTARVEDWFGSPNTNYGVLGVLSATPCTLATSDNATEAYRPKLVVVYTVAGGGISKPRAMYYYRQRRK